MKKLTKRDMEVIRSTFYAISAAMGWDKEFPYVELKNSVLARMREDEPATISTCDEDLKVMLNYAREEV